ncbi:MAG: hypothetical protein U7123_09175 [Potamolinea sp.]
MKNAPFSLLGSILIALASLSGVIDYTIAQETASACQSPKDDEYLLLVMGKTRANQEELQPILPQNIQITVCRYLESTVMRVAGFKNLEDAKNSARSLKEKFGLSAFLVQPAQSSPSTTSSFLIQPAQSPPSTTSSSYNPQPLGNGYAVLVDYFNQPEIAAQLKQLLGNDVGLVSYAQRPYLLALYTTDPSKANLTLRQLSDSGFWSMIVDSRRVTLLKSVVSF